MSFNIYKYDNQKFELDIKTYDPPKFDIDNLFILNRILISDDLITKYESFYKYIFNMNGGIYLSHVNSKPIKLKGTYFFATHPYYRNYAHFTLQCFCPLLLAINKGILNKKIKIIIDYESKFQKEYLQILNKIHGINFEVITLNPNHIYEVENCIYSDIFFDTNFNYTIVDAFEDLAKNFYTKFDNKFYVSRKNSPIRKCINEDDVINLMKLNNYDIILNEDLTVEDQIRLYANAKKIVSPHGASGANLMYCLNEFNFLEIFSENRTTDYYTSLLNNKNCNYSATINKATSNISKDAPYIIDLNLLKYALNNPNYKFVKRNIDHEALSVDKINSNINKIESFLNIYNTINYNYLSSTFCHKFNNSKSYLLSLQNFIQSKINDTNNYINQYKNYLMTAYGTIVKISDDYLVHDQIFDTNLKAILNDSILFLIKDEQFMNSINPNGKVTFIPNKCQINVIRNDNNNISIKINDLYLIALENGRFTFTEEYTNYANFIYV